jgi:hypothetical protein
LLARQRLPHPDDHDGPQHESKRST